MNKERCSAWVCAYGFVLGPLPSTLCVQCLHYVPSLLTGEFLQVLLAWEVGILSAFSCARKSSNISLAQVDFAVGRVELAQVDEIKQEANKVPPWISWLGSRFWGEVILICLSAILSTAKSFLLLCCFISVAFIIQLPCETLTFLSSLSLLLGICELLQCCKDYWNSEVSNPDPSIHRWPHDSKDSQ